MQTEVHKRVADATDVTNGYMRLNITPYGDYSNRVTIPSQPAVRQLIREVTAKLEDSSGNAISWTDILIGIRNPSSVSDKAMIPVNGIGNPEYAKSAKYPFECDYGFEVDSPCYTAGDVLTIMVMREAL